MNDDQSALTDFGGVARLFPLPNVVFFPFVMLPLHIFEPRYREMTADALAGDRLIAMVLLRPGWEEDYEGKPALYPVGCLGRIVAEQRLADGRFNLLLRGLSRVRLLDELEQGKLYRSARVRPLPEVAPAASAELDDLRRRLVECAPAWVPSPGPRSKLQELLASDLPLGSLCDIIGFALPLGLDMKQELLQELNVRERAERLLDYLNSVTPPASTAGQQPFPPAFSSN